MVKIKLRTSNLVGLSLLILASAPLTLNGKGIEYIYTSLVVALLYYLFKIAKETPKYFFSHALFFYYYLALLTGSVLAETGAIMIEINQTGSLNGSTLLAILTLLVFVHVSRFFFSLTLKKIQNSPFPSFDRKIETSLSLLFAVISLLLSAYHLFKFGSPIILGLERSTFFSNIGERWGEQLYTAALHTFPFCAALYVIAERKALKITSAVFIALYFFTVVFVFGHKASALILLLSILLVFYGATDGRLTTKLTITLLTFGFSILTLVYIHYSFLNRNPIEFISTRLALQAQLLWSVVEDPSLSLISANFLHCLTGCREADSLNDLITQRYLPAYLYDFYRETKTSLSGFHPATQIAAFGALAFFFLHSMIAALTGAGLAILCKLIHEKSALISAILFKLYFAIYYFHFVVSVEAIASNLTALCAFLLILYTLIKSIKPHRNKAKRLA